MSRIASYQDLSIYKSTSSRATASANAANVVKQAQPSMNQGEKKESNATLSISSSGLAALNKAKQAATTTQPAVPTDGEVAKIAAVKQQDLSNSIITQKYQAQMKLFNGGETPIK